MADMQKIFEINLKNTDFIKEDATHAVATIPNVIIQMPFNPNDSEVNNYNIDFTEYYNEYVPDQLIYGTTWNTIATKHEGKDALRIRTNIEGSYTEVRILTTYITEIPENVDITIWYMGDSKVPPKPEPPVPTGMVSQCIVRFKKDLAYLIKDDGTVEEVE